MLCLAWFFTRYMLKAYISGLASFTQESADDNKTVHIRTHHLLRVTSHHALTRHEVFWSEDSRCGLQWYVWSVHISAFKERRSATANKDHVAEEVRIDDNVKLLAQRTNIDGTDGTCLSIGGYICTESSGELKDVGNFRSADDEVSTTTKSLAVNLCRHIVDCLNKGLVPLANSTGEVRGSRASTNLDTSSRCLRKDRVSATSSR